MTDSFRSTPVLHAARRARARLLRHLLRQLVGAIKRPTALPPAAAHG